MFPIQVTDDNGINFISTIKWNVMISLSKKDINHFALSPNRDTFINFSFLSLSKKQSSNRKSISAKILRYFFWCSVHHAMFFCPDFSIFPCLFCFISFRFFYFDFIKIQCKEFIYFPFMLFNPPPAPPSIFLWRNSSKEEIFLKWKTKWNVCKLSFMLIYLFIYFITEVTRLEFCFFLFDFSINNSQKFYHFSAKFISFFNRCSVFLDSMVFTSH